MLLLLGVNIYLYTMSAICGNVAAVASAYSIINSQYVWRKDNIACPGACCEAIGPESGQIQDDTRLSQLRRPGSGLERGFSFNRNLLWQEICPWRISFKNINICPDESWLACLLYVLTEHKHSDTCPSLSRWTNMSARRIIRKQGPNERTNEGFISADAADTQVHTPKPACDESCAVRLL